MNLLVLLPIFFAHPTHHRAAPLFEIRERTEQLDKSETTTKIFDSGVWTIEHDGAIERGRFEPGELREIRRALQRAPWHITTSPIACFARDLNFTEYVMHGRLMFTDRVCSGKTADSVTRQALNLVKQDLAEERAEAHRR